MWGVRYDPGRLPESGVATTPQSTSPLSTPQFLNALSRVPEFTPETTLPFDSGIALFTHRDLPLHILSKDPERAEFGGKARELVERMLRGFPIPRTILVAADVFSDLVTGGSGSSNEGIAAPLSFMGTCGVLRDVLKHLSFGPIVFLRSSSPHEDSSAHCAAGLFTSRPASIAGSEDAFELATKAVLHSGFSPSAAAFYQKHGLPPAPLPMVVQPMLFDRERATELREYAPAFSGVIDTAHPQLIRVSLVRGLGGTIVDGHFCYRVSLHNQSLAVMASSGQQRSETLVALDSDQELHLEHRYCGESDALRIVNPELLAQTAVKRLLQCDPLAPQSPQEFEFCIPSQTMGVQFVQARFVPALRSDFQLPTPDWTRTSVDAVVASGQGISDPLPVHVFRVPNSPVEADEATRGLAEFNRTRPGGYIVLAVFQEQAAYQSLAQVAGEIRYENFCNARGIVFCAPRGDSYRFDPSELSHFSQFFRSERVPVMGVFVDSLSQSPEGEALLLGVGRDIRAVVGVNELSQQGYLSLIR